MVFAPKRDLWLSIIMWICIGLLFFSALSPFVIGGASMVETINFSTTAGSLYS